MYAVIAVVVLIVAWLAFSFLKGGSGVSGELLSACRGDEALAKRLIALEKKKNPNISDKEASQRALAAYRRDRGG